MKMKENRWNLKKRIIAGYLSLILVITAIISILFIHTRNTMQEEYMRQAASSMEGVIKDVDALVREVYAVSDSLTSNPQLDEFLDREYTQPNGRSVKKADTIRLYNQIISSNDILQQRQKPGAIYTAKGVLFNFKDANYDGDEVIHRLEELDVNSKEHLMRFYWYPLQDNFMVSRLYGEPRKDKIILGARRVFSVWKADYVCTHIFCIQEQDLYNAYWESIVEPKGDIYIVDQQGSLISSSREQAVAAGVLEAELKQVILNRNSDEFEWKKDNKEMQICIRQSEVNGWMAVAVIPVKSITGEVDALYGRIFIVVILCMLFCCVMLLYLYHTFINPINELNAAMMEVYSGNLNAYVKESGWHEVADMMKYFNAMLNSINVHVVEKLESDRKKKQLELDVLMGQINPHFLYNTLENIVWKSSEAGHPEIGRMAASLGRMYRLSISSGKVIVPLRQEIEHLMAYVKIQKNRYEDSFDLDLRMEAERVKKYYVLKILLQPIVENSFLYGMEGLTHKMIIRLKMRETGTHLEIRIMDNGIGMDASQLAKVREQIVRGRSPEEMKENRRSTGIGLQNVSERIELYFGIKNPVRIYSKKNVGTLTILTLPVLTAENMENRENRGK